MRSKNRPWLTDLSFYDVISLKNLTDNHSLNMLNAKCLLAGRYAEALERWLQYYTPQQVRKRNKLPFVKFFICSKATSSFTAS